MIYKKGWTYRMIISVNKDNQDRYLDLFKKSYQLLYGDSDPNARFSGLEEFYSKIYDIYDKDRSYAIKLPVDEPTLYIDANKRTIDTKLFSKSVNVQSDMMAETLIFSIDRYFDLKDFADRDNLEVWVQWIAIGADGKPVEGADPIYIFDVDTEADASRVRFGWPLTDVVTANAGKLQFAVRIFQRADVPVQGLNGQTEMVNKIVYSFNTLPASLTIQKALLPELNEEHELNYSSNYFDYIIRNSKYYGKGVAIPQTPTFDAPGFNLPVEATLVDDTLTLKAQAVVGDATPVYYDWYHTPVGATSALNCAEADFGTIGYAYCLAETTTRSNSDEYYSSDEVTNIGTDAYYYQLDDSANTNLPAWALYTDGAYEVVKDEDSGRTYLTTSSGLPLYEKYTTFTVPESNVVDGVEMSPVTGTYYVEAFGSKKVEEQYIVGPTQRSRECVLVSPSVINVTKELPSRLVMKVAEGEEDAKGTLSVDVAKLANDNTTYTYFWDRYADKDDLTPADTVETSESSTIVTDPGHYKVRIEADLNRQTNHYGSEWCKVTDMPVAPTLAVGADTSEGTGNAADGYAIVANPGEKLTLAVDASVAGAAYTADDLYSEELIYSWVIGKEDAGSRPLEVSDLAEGTDVNANKIVINALDGTWFYACTVTNKLNNEVAQSDMVFNII